MAQETQTGLAINLEGCNWEEDGREVQKGGDIYIYIYIYISQPSADSF